MRTKKTRGEKERMFKWEGFWSLISTKNGNISGCYLTDTFDREIFYN